MDANKTHGEKASRDLHKNANCYLEQILEATLHETTDVWRGLHPISKATQVRRTRLAEHC